MKSYEYLKHTADVKFRAYGENLEEAFTNAAYATADVVTDHSKVLGKTEQVIELQSEDLKALLYDFLEQFIVLIDTDNFLLAKVLEINISENDEGFSLYAKILGDTDISKYEIHTHIKAMTYQEMQIEEESGKVMMQVVLDL